LLRAKTQAAPWGGSAKADDTMVLPSAEMLVQEPCPPPTRDGPAAEGLLMVHVPRLFAAPVPTSFPPCCVNCACQGRQ